MLEIFAGRSGSGKTEFIHQKIEKSIKTGEENKDIVLLVPEQSSFQNERKILNALGAKGAANVSVLSFTRLYDKLEEEYGGTSKKRIDDGAKSVLMSLAAEGVCDKLNLYASRAKRADFADLMLSAVNEYKMCAITPEQLLETAGKVGDTRLREKLKESAVIYSAYNTLLSSSYQDPNDDLSRVYEMLCIHPYFAGKTVYIDSFNSFSGQEYKIIEAVIKQAEYVAVSITCERLTSKKAQNSIFRDADITMRKLIKSAEKYNVEVREIKWFEEQKRFKSKAISAIEESVFRFDGDAYILDEDNSVKLYEADDEYDEVQQTARDICDLVRNNGYRYRDITVIYREPNMYKQLIKSEFRKYGIPFFMSIPEPLESNSLIRLVISAFEAVHSSFNTENIFTFLKTGLTDLKTEQIFELENYVYMWDIKGRRWKKPFTMNPRGNVLNEDTSKEDEELKKIEEYRKKAVEPLTEFSKKLSDSKNGGDISKAVYELLERLNTAEHLAYIADFFDKQGDIKSKESEARIWDLMIGILDKMYTMLKNTSVDSRRYLELLKLIIKKSPISDIPQTLDQITIGTAGNIRSENPKAVFVIGALEGVFPASPKESGLFSDSERAELLGLELPLFESVYGMSLVEKNSVYSALSAPSERLYVSCHASNAKGEICEPSVIFREITAILGKNVKVRKHKDLSKEELFYTEEQGFEECAERWNENTPLTSALKEYFESSQEFKPKCSAIDKTIKDEPYQITSKKKAKELFGGGMRLSVSQAETYYLCPFEYFCKYGLKAYPRKKAVMDSGMYGSVVHYILENILKDTDFETLRQYDETELSESVNKYIGQYIEAIGGTDERAERFMAQFRLMESNIIIVLKRLIDEFSASKFVPSDFELEIGGEKADIPEYELILPSGEKVALVGKVDRVDTYIKDGKKYIRIVDYKTGNKTFRLSDVYYGLNIQMLLYLSAIEKNGKERYSEDKYTLMPAGVLYMPSTPTAAAGKFNSESEKKEFLNSQRKNLKMNGLLIDDAEILSAMEEGIRGVYIPASMTSKGTLSSSSLISAANYGKIFSYIDKKLIGMMNSLFDGKVERNPAKKGVNACEYCDYKTVCGYEKGKPSRSIEKYRTERVLELIEEENKNG